MINWMIIEKDIDSKNEQGAREGGISRRQGKEINLNFFLRESQVCNVQEDSRGRRWVGLGREAG